MHEGAAIESAVVSKLSSQFRYYRICGGTGASGKSPVFDAIQIGRVVLRLRHRLRGML